jgi:hypothetical protein
MGYLQFLPEYTTKELISALREYVLNGGRDIPTVYDLNQILNPKPKPLCPRMYSALLRKKKCGDYLSLKEGEFVKAYEEEQFNRMY